MAVDRQGELIAIIDKYSVEGMHPSALPRVQLIRASARSEPVHTVYESSLCWTCFLPCTTRQSDDS